MIDTSVLNTKITTAMIIRHADRGEVPAGQIECPLNELGKQHAFELGKKLKGFKKYKFFSSPVGRCQQTIEFIQKGINGIADKSIVEISNVLGEPGAFVLDRKNNAFGEFGGYLVVEKQIAHETLKGIRPIEEGTKIFMDYILSELDKADEETLIIFVTHDAIVGPVEFELTGENFNKEHWPDFADGFFVEKAGDNKRVIRNCKYFTLREF